MKVPMMVPPTMRQFRMGGFPLSLADRPHITWFKSGRLALYFLLKHLMRGRAGLQIVLPAYHCETIIEACEWAGLEPVLYRVREDLTPDLESLEGLLTDQAVAVVAIHYFGFQNSLDRVAELCRQQSIPLIEDAAHIDVVSPVAADSIGKHGDWVISSIRKFYPVFDGACVYPADSNSRDYLQVDGRFSVSDEARAVKHFLEGLVAQMRRRSMVMKSDEREPGAVPVTDNPAEPYTGRRYVDRRFSLHQSPEMTRVSRGLLRMVSGSRASLERRKSFRRLLDLSARLSGARPLFTELGSETVPYVFPLLLNDPDHDHVRLRQLGIEAYRWEDLAVSDCSVSQRYERHLVQLPCHQGLSQEQHEYMDEIVLSVLGR